MNLFLGRPFLRTGGGRLVRRDGLHHAGHAAHAFHAGGHRLVVLRNVGDHAVRREDEGRNGSGVLKGGAGDLRRVENAHFNEVTVFAGLGVVAEVAFALSDGVHHDARFVAGIGDDLAERFSFTDIPREKITVQADIPAAAAELKADGSENVYVVTCFSDRDKILSQVVKEA